MAATSSSSSISALGRDRRAIAQGWGAWSGRPIYERPRPAWARPAPRPVIVKDPVEKPKLTAEFFEAARLNFRAVKAAAHRLLRPWLQRPRPRRQDPARQGLAEPPRKTRRRHRAAVSNRGCSTASCPIPISAFASTWNRSAHAPNIVTDVDIRTDDPAEIAACMAAVRRHMGDRQPDAITGRDGLHFYDQAPSRAARRAYSGPTRTEALLITSSSLIGRACRGRPLRQRAAVDHRAVRSETQRCLPAVASIR